MNEVQIRARTDWSWQGILLYLGSEESNGRMVLTSFTMATIKPGQPVDPKLMLNAKDAQVLMDDLWACGVRPTEGAGTAGSMAAQTKHLEDMRKIAMDLLRVKVLEEK